jgi:two-component system NtrC family sensor kinase
LACIFLPDNPGKQLCLVGVGGMQEAKPEVGFLLPIDQGIPGYVYQSGISYFSNEGSTHSGGHSRNQWAAAAELAVPLRSGDQILGVIDCQRSANNTFSQDDLLIMESLAGILASVIIHARRYQERQQTISQLELVRETALDISNLELDKLIERVVRRARQLVKAPGAELGLFEPENDRVRVLATNNPWYLLETGARPLGIGVTGRIAQSGKPLAITDYNTWEGRLFPDQPHPCTAVAGVPLMIKGEVIGTLIVMDDVPGRIFTTEDLNLLELLAPQVAVSIRNARLYQELQERIKAQKMAERQLLQSARMAAVGEMAAGVAHELNNPLTTVSGFVELALEELPSDLPQRAELELVLAEAHRAQTVVRRLLDFSHQSDHPSFLINPNTLLDDLLPLIQHQIHGTDIRIHMNCQEAVKKILVEPNQIKQVLLNLVQNAIQAMPTGGDLIISTLPMDYQDHPGTVFSIQDSGEGISPEHLDRLFEPFFTTRSVGSGTGLGLSVSYGIVTDHKGIILVDSQIGNGSTFRVWFPVNNSIQLESKSNEPV